MILRQILVSVLTLMMLVASTGATIHQMVCLHSGNSEYSFSDFDCCKSDRQSDNLKRTCCEYFSLKLKTENVVVEEERAFTISSHYFLIPQNNKPIIKNQTLPQYHLINLPPPDMQHMHIRLQRFLC